MIAKQEPKLKMEDMFENKAVELVRMTFLCFFYRSRFWQTPFRLAEDRWRTRPVSGHLWRPFLCLDQPQHPLDLHPSKSGHRRWWFRASGWRRLRRGLLVHGQLDGRRSLPLPFTQRLRLCRGCPSQLWWHADHRAGLGHCLRCNEEDG